MFLYLDHDIISSIIFVKGIKISIFNPNRDVFKKSLKKIYIKKPLRDLIQLPLLPLLL